MEGDPSGESTVVESTRWHQIHVPTPVSNDRADTETSAFLGRLDLFLPTNQLPFLRPYFLPTCDMGDQSVSTRFRALFKSAVQAYENNTGITLAEHPLAIKVQHGCSVESVTTLLQDQVRASSAFRGNDRIIKSIKSIISTLSTLSATTALEWAIDLVRQLANGVFHIFDGF